MKGKDYFRHIFLSVTVLFNVLIFVNGQSTIDSQKAKNLYRPQSTAKSDTLYSTDDAQVQSQSVLDSLDQIRMQQIRDSIQAREIFVRDSIAQRQQILDSLNLIKEQLPILLEAALKAFTDNLIVSSGRIQIIGDSMLSNYTTKILPFTTDQPFTPWINTINLSDKPIKITLDKRSKKIITLQAPGIVCSFEYLPRANLLKITGQGVIASNASRKVYKSPLDSVFFDMNGRVVKIKRYTLFSQIVNNYQQGALLFKHLSQVKQYEYGADNQLTKLQLVNFCDQKIANDPVKVCFMVTYAIAKQGNNYVVTRRNDPANDFSDGTFTYEFDYQSVLKSVSFLNFRNTENWKTFVELNEAGYVSSYVYQNKGFVKNTLLFNYYLNDPKAKNKIETISCTFEDDGVSYYQINNTTGKSRVRDKLTMEWSQWK